MTDYLSGGRAVTHESLWGAITRLASVSHSVTSDNQRLIQRSLERVYEFSGNPSEWYPHAFEELKEQDPFAMKASRAFEQQTGLIVAANA